MLTFGGLRQQAKVTLLAVLVATGAFAAPVVAGSAGSALLGVEEASAATYLGGINFRDYCAARWGSGARAVNQAPYNAGTWVCVTSYWSWVNAWPFGYLTYTLEPHGIDTNHACRWQYGDGAWSASYNWSDPSSWGCYR